MPPRTHGESAGPASQTNRKSKEFGTWIQLRGRCKNPNDKAYKYYGGRGITVDPSWDNSFEAFLRDMGRAPTPKHTIERLKNSEGYGPGNCAWVTRLEQQQNLRSNHNLHAFGFTQTISAWSRAAGVSPMTLLYRVRALGLPASVALVLSPKPRTEKHAEFKARTAQLGDAANYFERAANA